MLSIYNLCLYYVIYYCKYLNKQLTKKKLFIIVSDDGCHILLIGDRFGHLTFYTQTNLKIDKEKIIYFLRGQDSRGHSMEDKVLYNKICLDNLYIIISANFSHRFQGLNVDTYCSLCATFISEYIVCH